MKRKLKEELKKRTLIFPLQITIQYSEIGSSLMVLHTAEELNMYLHGKDVADSIIRSIKKRNNKTYVEADTSQYAEIRELLYPRKISRKES